MKITYRAEPTDPNYPIMEGKTPLAKEFNDRQKKLFADGVNMLYDYQQVTTVLLEILVDDYNKRHASRKKKPRVA